MGSDPIGAIDGLPRVRPAAAREHRAIARCLGRAFHDDPVAEYLFPDARTRVRRYAAFCRFALGLLAPHGRVHTCGDVAGAALWQAPEPPRPSRLALFRNTLSLALHTRGAFSRAAALGELTFRSHPREPHWYLAIIGTAPELRGRGLGSALLRETLRTCDDTGRPAYLESSKASNVPFYESHGFAVVAELSLPGGPTLWPMYRSPR